MTFGGIIMTVAIIVILLMILGPIIYHRNTPSMVFQHTFGCTVGSLGCVLLFFWFLFLGAGLKHTFNAKHYSNLLKTQARMEVMAQKIPDPEIKQLYEKELNDYKAKVERVKAKMSVKDWVRYYTTYYNTTTYYEGEPENGKSKSEL